ncbi:putative Na+-dependent transporter [Nostoc flagelliforme CCNUN1]|uniref:Putative Na+-dependent transporter n=1 Tax=Nostoc flagelliforme CCNUN1 TaxID=2038116 RepID=A0A2K8SUQ1_9NOSO|nr:hypothetical protein [Nostoc flagelliforme]AUB39053.1 putative Na+-dependent transporter [Nostoc flagelliforme CCNUN1]
MEANFLTAVFLPLALFIIMIFPGVVTTGVLLRERNNFISYVIDVGWATLVLNVVAMALSFVIATLTRLGEERVTAITIEVGIQNGTLAIAIASTPTLLNTPTMAIPGAIYGLLMFVTGARFAW